MILDPINRLIAKNEKYRYLEREALRYPLHPIIEKILVNNTPDDYNQVIAEWPHQSTLSSDPQKIAYTRTIEHGIADRQTQTSLGRYIKQHFTQLKDHEIRDLVGLAAAADSCSISNDLDDIIRAAMEGPHSCMSDDFGDDCHPYRVYDPSLGWSIALRITDTNGYKRIDGRALIYEYLEAGHLQPTKIFVRSYKRSLDDDDGYSYADEKLEAWMKDQGIKKRDGWPKGTKLAYHELGNRWGEQRFIAPYIDGCIQTVNVDTSGSGYMTIDPKGRYMCDNTDGYAYDNDQVMCEDCNEYYHEDDVREVGYYGNMVCDCCMDDNYVEAYGRRGRLVTLQIDDTIEVDGTFYDRHETDQYDLVCTDEDNDVWAKKSDCLLDYDDNYILKDEAVIIGYGEYEGQYIHEGDAMEYDGKYFQCRANLKDYVDEQKARELQNELELETV